MSMEKRTRQIYLYVYSYTLHFTVLQILSYIFEVVSIFMFVISILQRSKTIT